MFGGGGGFGAAPTGGLFGAGAGGGGFGQQQQQQQQQRTGFGAPLATNAFGAAAQPAGNAFSLGGGAGNAFGAKPAGAVFGGAGNAFGAAAKPAALTLGAGFGGAGGGFGVTSTPTNAFGGAAAGGFGAAAGGNAFGGGGGFGAAQNAAGGGGGTRQHRFVPLRDKQLTYQSISATNAYATKSHEELRWEDVSGGAGQAGAAGGMGSTMGAGKLLNVARNTTAFTLSFLALLCNSLSCHFRRLRWRRCIYWVWRLGTNRVCRLTRRTHRKAQTRKTSASLCVFFLFYVHPLLLPSDSELR